MASETIVSGIEEAEGTMAIKPMKKAGL